MHVIVPRCFMEYHLIDYYNSNYIQLDVSQSETQDAAPKADKGMTSLKYAHPVPSGIASLSHDGSLKARPPRFFTAAYTGLTTENFEDSFNLGGDPEDRVFIFRQVSSK